MTIVQHNNHQISGVIHHYFYTFNINKTETVGIYIAIRVLSVVLLHFLP